MERKIPVDEKGIPHIHHEWKNCDSDTLTKLFSPSKYSRVIDPDDAVDVYVERLQEGSEKTRWLFKHKRNVAYGEKPLQVLDIYLPESLREDAPVLLYIHGGYWQFLNPASHGLVARHLVPLGVVVVLVGYTLCPEGTLTQIIQECKDAAAFCARRYPKSRGLYISGHSAGGHLTAMMLTTDWQKEYKLPRDLFKGAVPMSPLFDLRPLVTTSINDALGLTSDSALASSPISYLPQIAKACQRCRLLIIYGDHEAPSFKIQAQHFIQLLKEHGADTPFIEVEKRDHFELLLGMVNKDDPCVKALEEMIFSDTRVTEEGVNVG